MHWDGERRLIVGSARGMDSDADPVLHMGVGGFTLNIRVSLFALILCHGFVDDAHCRGGKYHRHLQTAKKHFAEANPLAC